MDPTPTKMEVTETQWTEMKIGMMVLLNALMTRLQLPWLDDGSCGREVGKEGVVGPAATCARACACEVELAESSCRWAKGGGGCYAARLREGARPPQGLSRVVRVVAWMTGRERRAATRAASGRHA
jgi:hypothetical protein